MNYTEYCKITKAARGWKASEMDTWSDSKKKLILDQYGKEGLTPNTYAYLLSRIKTSTQSTKPNFISRITSFFSPKELQMTINEAKTFDNGIALKNYQRITGKTWNGEDLSNYTRDAIRKEQAKYGIVNGDGIWGQNTQKAKEIWESNQNKSQVKNQTNEDNSRFSINNPLLAFTGDIFRSKINNAYRSITGDQNATLISGGKAITDIPEKLKEVIRNLIITNGKKSKGSIDSRAWKKYQGTYTGGKRSIWSRTFGGGATAVEHTLGQFNWETDPNTGHVIVKDVYDFNIGQESKGQGIYSTARDWAGKNASKNTDPIEGKRTYAIDLGKMSDWTAQIKNGGPLNYSNYFKI